MPSQQPLLIRRLLTGVIFGFIVIIALLLVSDLRQVGAAVLQFRWAYFPAVLGLTLGNYLLRGYKFHYYLRQIGAEDIRFGESLRIFVAGFPLAVTPGKVGEALKGLWIHAATGISTPKGIAVVLAERISDGLAVLILSILGVVAYPQYWPAFTGILLALAALIVISQIRPAAYFLLNLAGRLPVIRRIIPGLRDFYEGSFILFKPGATFIAVLLGSLSWLGEGLGFYLILLGLGLPPSLQLASLAIFILAFSTVVGAVSALPGGLGAAEASISGMLILLAGLSSDVAAAATLLIRFATLWFGVSLGLLVWVFSRKYLGLNPQAVEAED